MIARHVVRMQNIIKRSYSAMTAAAPTADTTLLRMESSTTPPVVSATAAAPTAPRIPIPRYGVDYRGKVVLAPMVRSGELPSRLLALHYGADLVWGPETVDKSMIGTTERTNPRTGCKEWTRVSNNAQQAKAEVGSKESIIFRIDPAREKDKFIYQIGTASPTLAVQAASLVAPYCSGIDVNAGCPKPFSTSGGMGAQLLRTPDLLCSILSALVAEVGTPHEIGISVKIRLLETPELTSSLVTKLCKTGITGLTIHCRTTPMRPRERAIREQLRMIGNICRAHGVACLMNGDVSSRGAGFALAAEFGVDGAMIATAAEANPSVFRPKEQGGPAPWREIVKEYLRYALSVENKFGNTKFSLAQLMPGKEAAARDVNMARSHVDVLRALGIDRHEGDGEEMMRAAAAVDVLLGLDQPRVTRKDVKKQRRRENDARQDQRQQQHGERIDNKRGLNGGGDGNNSRLNGQQQQQHHRHKKQRSETVSTNALFQKEGAVVGEGPMPVMA